jgi:hypothetical protein
MKKILLPPLGAGSGLRRAENPLQSVLYNMK